MIADSMISKYFSSVAFVHGIIDFLEPLYKAGAIAKVSFVPLALLAI